MFVEEAIWIRDVLAALALGEGATVLDLGSSSEPYRRLAQPHIDYYIFHPLRKRGVRIFHVDAKADEGVNIVCDLASRNGDGLSVKMPPADVVICASLLEHVEDRDLVLRRVQKIANPDGVIIVTVPYLFRYHCDPIDNLYRPTNKELEALFPSDRFEPVSSAILEVEAMPTVIRPSLVWRVINRACRPFGREPRPPRVVRNKVSVLAVRRKK